MRAARHPHTSRCTRDECIAQPILTNHKYLLTRIENEKHTCSHSNAYPASREGPPRQGGVTLDALKCRQPVSRTRLSAWGFGSSAAPGLFDSLCYYCMLTNDTGTSNHRRKSRYKATCSNRIFHLPGTLPEPQGEQVRLQSHAPFRHAHENTHKSRDVAVGTLEPRGAMTALNTKTNSAACNTDLQWRRITSSEPFALGRYLALGRERRHLRRTLRRRGRVDAPQQIPPLRNLHPCRRIRR